MRVIAMLGTVLVLTGFTWSAQDDPLALRNELGIVHARNGHLEDGLRNFTLVLADDPDNPAALNNSANIYFLQGDHDTARRLYEKAAAGAREGGIYLNLGILLHAMGETKASEKSVQDGLDLIGDLDLAYYMLGLSKAAPSESRASDQTNVSDQELESLLARAWSQVPTNADTPAEEPKKVSEDDVGHRDPNDPDEGGVSTRPGAAKAADASTGINAARLFWMEFPR